MVAGEVIIHAPPSDMLRERWHVMSQRPGTSGEWRNQVTQGQVDPLDISGFDLAGVAECQEGLSIGQACAEPNDGSEVREFVARFDLVQLREQDALIDHPLPGAFAG